MTVDYEYTGLVAECWDLLRGDTSKWPDLPFYRRLIEQQGGPALDVGCGTGRLLLDYLADGLDLHGVDNSPEMLAICRAKAQARGIDVSARLHEQEMHRLDLPVRYATILVPSSSFQLLTQPADATAALARFRVHLRPGGLLVMSIMSKLWPGSTVPPQMQWSRWYKLGEAERHADGATIRRWIRTCYDHDAQLEHEENRYELVRDGVLVRSELHRRSPSVRWYSQGQIESVMADAGFVDLILTNGFTMDRASQEDTTFCVLAHAPGQR